jgi:DNA-binding transcriptional regulator YdaS (Cro superfamily)
MAHMSDPLTRAAQACGGFSKLAGLLGVSPQAISNWRARGVPVEHCAQIEIHASAAVTRRELRPDDWHRIWPELISEEHPAPTENVDASQAA